MNRPLQDATPAVLVNANNIMALSVIRSLGRKGVPVIGVFGKRRDSDPYGRIVRSSRFLCGGVHSFDESDYERDCLRCLRNVSQAIGGKAVLFPVSDHDMAIVSRNRAELEPHYHLLMPPQETLAVLLEKQRFYQLASERGFPIPRTFLPSALPEIEGIARAIRYPCIIKPSWRTEEWIRRYRNEKVFRCESAAELRQRFSDIFPSFNRLTVQEIVTGPETNIVCTFTYLDRQSEPLAMFMCRKIRQFPPHFGNTALAENTWDPEADAITRRICREMGLAGYISIEFKRDARDNILRILEVTPARINRQAGLSDECGMNIPHVWYGHLLGRHAESRVSLAPRRWASEVNEVRALPYYLRTGEWTLAQWVRSYRHVRRWEVFAADDIKPLLMLLPSILRHGLLARRKP